MLAQKDKKAIPGILQGMFTDAPVMVQADPGQVDLVPCVDITPVSSLAANLAAKEKNNQAPVIPESLGPEPVTEIETGIKTIKKGEDVEIIIGDRSYRIRRLKKNQTFDVMRVNIRVMSDNAFHIDTLDLYNARHRTAYINTASDELQFKPDILKKDLGRVLLKLEELQDELIGNALESKPDKKEMSQTEQEQALKLLKSPDLLDRILQGFDTYGLVGERTNKITGYLAAVSRKLDKPLAVVIQSSSAPGKSTLMDVVLDMVPKEDKVQYSAMTGQSLFYFGDKNLKHKILAIVDESREQTRAIHKEQRKAETLDGLVKRLDKKDVLNVQRNAQRLLKPLEVVNPYADKLTFLDDHTRTRRDHKKYLTLIRTITFFHQYQRSVKVLVHNGKPVQYIEVSLKDIAAANELANEVLGRSLDELPPQTRRFLDLISQMVQTACKKQSIEKEDYRFTQRDIRKYTGWSDYQVKSHLRKLASLEYVLVHHGGRGQQFVYELLYNNEGKDGQRFLMCLIDADELKQTCKYDLNREHEKAKQETTGCIQGAIREHGGSVGKIDNIAIKNKGLSPQPGNLPDNAYIGTVAVQSHHTSTLAAKGN